MVVSFPLGSLLPVVVQLPLAVQEVGLFVEVHVRVALALTAIDILSSVKLTTGTGGFVTFNCILRWYPVPPSFVHSNVNKYVLAVRETC